MQELSETFYGSNKELPRLLKMNMQELSKEGEYFQVIDEIISGPTEITFGVSSTCLKYRNNHQWLVKALQILLLSSLSTAKSQVTKISTKVQICQIFIKLIQDYSLLEGADDEQKNLIKQYCQTQLEQICQLSYYNQQSSRLNVLCLRLSKAPLFHCILELLIKFQLAELKQQIYNQQIRILGINFKIALAQNLSVFINNFGTKHLGKGTIVEITCKDTYQSLLSSEQDQIKIKLWNKKNQKGYQKNIKSSTTFKKSLIATVSETSQAEGVEVNELERFLEDSLEQSEIYDDQNLEEKDNKQCKYREDCIDLLESLQVEATLQKQKDILPYYQISLQNKQIFKTDHNPQKPQINYSKSNLQIFPKYPLKQELKQVLQKINKNQKYKTTLNMKLKEVNIKHPTGFSKKISSSYIIEKNNGKYDLNKFKKSTLIEKKMYMTNCNSQDHFRIQKQIRNKRIRNTNCLNSSLINMSENTLTIKSHSFIRDRISTSPNITFTYS